MRLCNPEGDTAQGWIRVRGKPGDVASARLVLFENRKETTNPIFEKPVPLSRMIGARFDIVVVAAMEWLRVTDGHT